jgi:hypothetical protein
MQPLDFLESALTQSASILLLACFGGLMGLLAQRFLGLFIKPIRQK